MFPPKTIWQKKTARLRLFSRNDTRSRRDSGEPPQRFIAVVDVIAPVVSFGNATVSAVQINGGGNSASLTQSAPYTATLNYAVGADGSIIDQVQIGLNRQLPEACAYSGIAGAGAPPAVQFQR